MLEDMKAFWTYNHTPAECCVQEFCFGHANTAVGGGETIKKYIDKYMSPSGFIKYLQ